MPTGPKEVGQGPSRTNAEQRERLEQCLVLDSDGRPTLSVRLPDRSALDALAETLGAITSLE